MLERIALHQTRLHTPGLGLDSKGVALGTKGLVLLASIDRLVALFAAYTRERSLEDLLPGLIIRLVRSKLGMREIVVEFAAESSERMDRISATARLVGGFAFTGTARHFVQYRDAAAPFGYDAVDLLATDAALALYHTGFSQTYDIDRPLDLRALLLRLMLRTDPSTRLDPGPRIVVAEPGLGPPLVQYLVRSDVAGEVCTAEWPPESAFEPTPLRRWVIRLPEPPLRMRSLLQETPGITTFVPSGPGVAVEAGFRHAVELRACPLFDPAGLVLLRGRADEPWVIERLPPLGSLNVFARVELRPPDREPATASSVHEPEEVRIPLRVAPSSRPWRDVTATWITPRELPLLRRLAYAVPHDAIAQATIALTSRGALLRSRASIEVFPIGSFFVETSPGLYIPAGYETVPAVGPETIARAFGVLDSHVVFLGADARGLAVAKSAFVPLEAALLQAPSWEPALAQSIDLALDEPIDLKVGSIGLRPMRGVESGKARHGE